MTENHIKEVSLAAIFLTEAAQKADMAFGVHAQSHAHTTREAKEDITKIAHYLVDRTPTVETGGRDRPDFQDPTNKGLDKLCSPDWLPKALCKVQPEVEEEGEHQDHEIDLDYELYNST